MSGKSKAWIWALGSGLFVSLWIIAALLAGIKGWPALLYMMIVLTAGGMTAGLAALIVRGHEKRKARKLERELRRQAREAGQNPSAAAPLKTKVTKKSYGPEIDPVITEGNRALSEMGRLYMSIQDPEVRQKINEIMRITDKITQDAISDPSDIPQIKKFMNYYLPTTIKLLNAYDRMSALGVQGENVDKSMKSINDMLDQAIEAYKKRLDSLFENQALDIETDIEVMNTMLAREGLSGDKDFDI